MKVNIIKPSSTEGEVIRPSDQTAITTIVPFRWAQRQQGLTVAPIEVVNDKGVVLDAAVITVNQKTGKLVLTKLSNKKIECDADALEPTESEGA